MGDHLNNNNVSSSVVTMGDALVSFDLLEVNAGMRQPMARMTIEMALSLI